MSENADMVDLERLRDNFSMLLEELEQKRARLQEIEAEVAAQSHELDARKNLIEELQQTVAIWKEKYTSLNSRNSSSEPPISTALSEPPEEELQSLESVKNVSADHGTVAIDMRKALLEAQKVARSPEGLSSEPRSAVNRAKTH